jgi:hypothetical protein
LTYKYPLGLRDSIQLPFNQLPIILPLFTLQEIATPQPPQACHQSARPPVTYAEDAETDWNSLTVPRLKEELTQRGLSATGSKATLVTRLEEYNNCAEIEAAATAASIDSSTRTIAQTQVELAAPGLSISGNKTIILARLKSGAAEVTEPPPPKNRKEKRATSPPHVSGAEHVDNPKMGYFMQIKWDIPWRIKAKLAIEPLYISSIVLLLPSSFSSIIVLVSFYIIYII